MTTDAKQGEAQLAVEVCRYLREIHPQMANLRELGERFHISPFHLQRQFKRATGISPREYAAEAAPGRFQGASPQRPAHRRRHLRRWLQFPRAGFTNKATTSSA